MIDAHCHVASGNPEIRELLIGRDFLGTHPWEADRYDEAELSRRLAADSRVGVGEIGLDRLRDKVISESMRAVFVRQLEIAEQFGRPVVLHGAKCWGEVCREAMNYSPRIPAFLFHGFSRSDGLLPAIVSMNGFVSVGPAILNDHAVNYRALAKKIPADRLLVETDRTEANAAECPDVLAVARKLAEIRGVDLARLDALLDENGARFLVRFQGLPISG